MKREKAFPGLVLGRKEGELQNDQKEGENSGRGGASSHHRRKKSLFDIAEYSKMNLGTDHHMTTRKSGSPVKSHHSHSPGSSAKRTQ